MTLEDVLFYECLLSVGLSDAYEKWLNDALETQNPIEDRVLELSECVSDLDKTISCLWRYRMGGNIDERAVCERVRHYFRDAYHENRLPLDTILSLMTGVALHIGAPHYFDMSLWGSMNYFGDYFDLAKDGVLSLEAVEKAFFAYLEDGTPLDSESLWNFRRKRTLFDRIKACLRKK